MLLRGISNLDTLSQMSLRTEKIYVNYAFHGYKPQILCHISSNDNMDSAHTNFHDWTSISNSYDISLIDTTNSAIRFYSLLYDNTANIY